MRHKANLFVISAPSGAGKTSLVRTLAKKTSQIKISVSYTTRPKRPGDREGVDYCFVEEAHFQKMLVNQAFLEYATIYGYHYGTAKQWVLDQLQAGYDVILEIDWQGARQVRQLFSPVSLVFIFPPSSQALRERLLRRQQDELSIINRRLEAAQAELKHYVEFDYLVVNDHFDQAIEDLLAIVSAGRLQRRVQEVCLSGLLAELYLLS